MYDFPVSQVARLVLVREDSKAVPADAATFPLYDGENIVGRDVKSDVWYVSTAVGGSAFSMVFKSPKSSQSPRPVLCAWRSLKYPIVSSKHAIIDCNRQESLYTVKDEGVGT